MKQIFFFSILLLGSFFSVQAQNPVNWTREQLLEPAVLADAINAKKNVPAILSVGPGSTIPGSIHIGMTNTDENIARLKKELGSLSRNAPVVIYCGCCPFEHCPNVRPAIATLKELKFTNYKLLNIPKNMKADWIDKGYPTN